MMRTSAEYLLQGDHFIISHEQDKIMMITCGALSNWHLISQRLQAKPRLRVFHVIVYSKLLFQPGGFIKAECQSRHFLIKARFMHKRVNTRVKLRVSSTVPCYQLLQSVSLSHDRSNLSFSSWSLLKSLVCRRILPV